MSSVKLLEKISPIKPIAPRQPRTPSAEDKRPTKPKSQGQNLPETPDGRLPYVDELA